MRTDAKPVHHFWRKGLSWIWRVFLWVWKPIVGFSVILGIATGLYGVSSRLSVTPRSPSDPNDPFSTPFEVRNEGYLAIYDVNFYCGIHEVKTKNNSRALNLRTRINRPPIPVIEPGETTIAYCKPFPPWRDIDYADITVEVQYRPKFLLWQKEKHLRYVAARDSSGRLSWSPRALSE